MEAPSSPTPPTASNSNPESKAQEQARLRRERRNAKIVAGGSARLDKITSLNGGLAPIESGEYPMSDLAHASLSLFGLADPAKTKS